MRKQMKIEDGILDEFEDMQRQILQKTQETAEAKQATDKARKETAKAKRETNEARQKIAEVEREAVEAKKNIVHNFKTAGVPTEIIMQATGLSREEVDDI